ncbi:phosphatidylserine decarboxylase [Youngiibacter multivorans]|uniref:Phosphatidylserine decarboxylase proenzyme n=1 Tax=Youngiibacter multivorans TaxID=937251 RepID=A0ABS4G5U6_9CLOT|nr:phosphatidylserine decarboxylase [Youngiibacter multivorans]MBP1919655.1 phosphatidylserine decarboxylase [Youngiibacter multivorans]
MIRIYDRKKGDYDTEVVVGGKYIEWLYGTMSGKWVLEALVKRKMFSSLYGRLMDLPASKKMIPSFIKDNSLDINGSVKDLKDFESFNDFFTRSLLPESRPIPNDSSALMSPVDGRLLAYENIDIDNLVQVKGMTYTLGGLIGNGNIKDRYIHGTMLVFRLCPLDYHRFHFVDSGICSKPRLIRGGYYSVNPVSLARIPNVYLENKRMYSLMRSDNFSDILIIEVGATNVGSIVQTYTPSRRFERGAEKGYFKFGGSTVLLFFKNGAVKIDQDILDETAKGIESKVLMGETIGRRARQD